MEISEDDIPYILTALDQYAAYMRAVQRDGAPYQRIAERLRNTERKGPGREEKPVESKRKRSG